MEARNTLSSADALDAYATSGSSPTVRVHLGDWPAEVRYELTGNPGGPLVVVLGGISASRHVAAGPVATQPGWWEAHVGPERPIDTARHALLSFDFLGGPTSPCPPGRAVTTRDQARALAAILDRIAREQIDLLVGASYGGMVALGFAELYPERCARLVVISAAHRAHPMATAWRSLQRRVVQLGARGGQSREALEVARGLAMTTYRSAEEFEERFAVAREDEAAPARYPVADYLAARGRDFAARFDADAFLTLSDSIDAHRIEPARIHTPLSLVAVDHDALVPPWLCEELRDRVAGPVRYRVLSSATGHDAFLTETAQIGSILRQELVGGAAASLTTRTVRAAVGVDRAHGAVMPPLYLSSNFTFAGFERKREHDYTRTSNPTRAQLAAALAELEGGHDAVVTSSGMSAVALVLQLLRPGDRLLATNDCYGGLHRLVCAQQARGAFEAVFADLTGDAVATQVREHAPRMVWVETPSNPLLRITDLRRVADAAHEVGALLVVDNTLLSPAWQRPLEHGADVVVHSTTKFINGHSDVVGGAAIAADPAVAEDLAWWGNCLGLTGAPFDSYLTLRGVRTLYARTRVHGDNAVAIVAALGDHPAVSAVFYPGLPGHPGHPVAARQQLGFGSMLSFELAGGIGAVRALVQGLEHFALAESLGGVESLIAHPSSMTHAAMDPEARRAAGIGDSLLRLSVGIEAAEDLVADLGRGLDRAQEFAR